MGELLLIPNVLPETRFWKVKVTVIEKSDPIENPGKITRQRLVFSDAKKNKVQAVIFAENIEIFKNDFVLHKTYFVSNAIVRDVIQRYRISSYPYQWTITGKSSVDLCEENMPSVDVSLTNYTSFSEFEPIAGSNADVDVIAVVIHIFPRRSKNIRPEKATIIQEFIVIEKSEIPILLTLWDQYAVEDGSKILDIGIDNVPILVGHHLRVSDYKGVSLSTKSGSILTVNPSMPAADDLRQWAIEKLPHLHNLASQFLEKPIQQQIIQLSPSQPTTPISEAKKKAQMERFFWTKAALLIEDFEQPFQYTGCTKCKKATNARVNVTFRCNTCQCKSNSMANARINIILKDDSGDVPAQIFGELAEKVFGYSANDFAVQQENSQDVKFTRANFSFPLGKESHVMQLRSKDEQRSQEKQLIVNYVRDAMNFECLKNTDSEAAQPLFEIQKESDTKQQESSSKVARKLHFPDDIDKEISKPSSVDFQPNHPIATSSSDTISGPSHVLSKTTLQLIEAHQIKKEKIEENQKEVKKTHSSQKISPISKKPKKK